MRNVRLLGLVAVVSALGSGFAVGRLTAPGGGSPLSVSTDDAPVQRSGDRAVDAITSGSQLAPNRGFHAAASTIAMPEMKTK